MRWDRSRQHPMAARMYPDHDWLDSDFESLESLEDEGPVRLMTAEERIHRDFEKLYEKYLRMPAVQAMDQVTALRTFLDKYPHFMVQP